MVVHDFPFSLLVRDTLEKSHQGDRTWPTQVFGRVHETRNGRTEYEVKSLKKA